MKCEESAAAQKVKTRTRKTGACGTRISSGLSLCATRLVVLSETIIRRRTLIGNATWRSSRRAEYNSWRVTADTGFIWTGLSWLLKRFAKSWPLRDTIEKQHPLRKQSKNGMGLAAKLSKKAAIRTEPGADHTATERRTEEGEAARGKVKART